MGCKPDKESQEIKAPAKPIDPSSVFSLVNQNRTGRRRSVAMRNPDMKETPLELSIKKIEREVSDSECKNLFSSLKNHFLFFDMADSDINSIINEMFFCEMKSETIVFKQGDVGCSFLIISSEIFQ